jgi:hypothetical protein
MLLQVTTRAKMERGLARRGAERRDWMVRKAMRELTDRFDNRVLRSVDAIQRRANH